ncbi:MAG: ATP-dependent DNA helicase RecQ [Flavobacteriia bacterium]|nr:ATP-dependent DNA helicase RecQ [Flavobacteriia bacterium]
MRKQILCKETYEKGISKLPSVLEQMGYSELRPGQSEAVHNILGSRDTLCFMPTSFGKSAIYQIPTMCLNWKALVFSPLLSLIQDQIESITSKGFSAGQVSSNQSEVENGLTMTDWETGILNFMFAAPEKLRNDRFVNSMAKVRPDLVVIDEAHCISSWGDTFRTSYQNIGLFVEIMNPKVVLAMTATRTEEVEQDIRERLGIVDCGKIEYFPERDNLKYKTGNYSLKELVNQINSVDGSTIVYFSTVKETEDAYNKTKTHINGGALMYHGALSSGRRVSNQSTFMAGSARVMFATKAFGMGIDKPDIRSVIHKGFPSSLEDYAQETGRAGRDGKNSLCTLLYDPKSYDTQAWFVDCKFPSRASFNNVYKYINLRKDRHNFVYITQSEIADDIGIHSSAVASCINVMDQSKVVEKQATKGKIFKVKFIKDHILEKYQSVLEAIEDLGILNRDTGFYEADIDAVSGFLDLKPNTFKTKLRELDKDGYIVYVAPFRGTPIKIISDLSLINFEKLERKKEMEMLKLETVRQFINEDDSNKSQFLHRYFS